MLHDAARFSSGLYTSEAMSDPCAAHLPGCKGRGVRLTARCSRRRHSSISSRPRILCLRHPHLQRQQLKQSAAA